MGMATVIASAAGNFLGYWLFAVQEAPLLAYFGIEPTEAAIAHSFPRIWIVSSA